MNRKWKYTEEEIESVKRLAQDGNADAQRELGLMYSDGVGVPTDDGEAAKWWRLAADQGHAGGQNGLGWSYLNGKGVQQDFTEAIKWFRLAADQGYADSQANLGQICIGKGRSKKNEEAIKWFRLAADQGHIGAIRALERMPADDGEEKGTVRYREFSFNECTECGRVGYTTGARRLTTFGREGVTPTHHGGVLRPGGSIDVVKKIRSAQCNHCHPEVREKELETWRASDEKAKGKVFADDKHVSIVRKKGSPHGALSMITLTADANEIDVYGSVGGSCGAERKQLTEEELEDRISNVRSEYERIRDDMRHSRGSFDWRSVCRKTVADKERAGNGQADMKERNMMIVGVETQPIPFYRCAHCRSIYATEENAKKCALSCKESKAHAYGGETGELTEDDVKIHKPSRCGYCNREYEKEDEARACSVSCKEQLAKDWAGKIIMAEWSSFTDIWIVRSNPSAGDWGRAIWIRVGKELFHIKSDSYFNPIPKNDALKELTEEEFVDRMETVFARCDGVLNDLTGSKGRLDWRSAISGEV